VNSKPDAHAAGYFLLTTCFQLLAGAERGAIDALI